MNPLHMQENFYVFDFCLEDQEMDEIRTLECGKWFFTLNLEGQEHALSSFVPAD